MFKKHHQNLTILRYPFSHLKVALSKQFFSGHISSFLPVCKMDRLIHTHMHQRHKCLAGNINLSNVMGSFQGARHSLAGISLHFQTEFSDFKISIVGSEQKGWTHLLGPSHLSLKPWNLVFSLAEVQQTSSVWKDSRLRRCTCTSNDDNTKTET